MTGEKGVDGDGGMYIVSERGRDEGVSKGRGCGEAEWVLN